MSSIAEDLIPHMRRVHAAEQDLRDLGLLWQMIEASASISCPEDAGSILPMLTRTRQRFGSLQGRLVRQLGTEIVAELNDELASTAQCTIDILVRNLFERTADVGFLATDDDIRSFCAGDAACRDAARAALLRRLAEYRAKYTVYDDIIVLDAQGVVLARLDGAAAVAPSEDPAVARSADPVIAQALARAGYVERHAFSDLGAPGAPALLYGHRIDDAAGRGVGVLVLRFRMGDEMQRIFASVVAPLRQVAVTLLDADNRVIASNDESHVPLGARLQTAADGSVALTVFGGREYLSVTRATAGYQGYAGPGWRAQTMVSLLTAFRSSAADGEEAGSGEALTLDDSELSRIRGEVDAINADLRRVIWNGCLLAGSRGPSAAAAGGGHGGGGDGGQARLKAVLRQIQDAGTRTRDRVTLAIGHLYRTSMGRARHQARELARLAADIMDRNLYERANDCRWWALSPLLRRELGAAGTNPAALNAMLAHVNSLYTVYTRLVVFDADGRIRGVSNDADITLVGQPIGHELQAATATLGDSQRYAVGAFAASAISDGVPTYVYLAGVREAGRLLGGIAIVFNAEREFRAMLDDVLAGRDGLAAFVDAEGRVVASASGGPAIGERLSFAGDKPIVEHAGIRYACADVAAAGYREFKSQDGYRNGVRAVVALRLGAAERRRTALSDHPVQPLPKQSDAPSQEFAVFQVGPNRLGLPAAAVLEARALAGLVHAPIGLLHGIGLVEVATPRGPTVIPVLCGRRLFGVRHPPRDSDGVLLVLARPDAPNWPLLGLRVDDVLSVVDSDAAHLRPAPAGLRGHSPLLMGLLRLGRAGGDGEVLVQIVDADAIAGFVPLRREQIALDEAVATAA